VGKKVYNFALKITLYNIQIITLFKILNQKIKSELQNRLNREILK
jgi:hypothetical protein